MQKSFDLGKHLLERTQVRTVRRPVFPRRLLRFEQVFAKLKAPLRQAAERIYETLWCTVGRLMDRFQADECLNFFRHSGYVSD
ncbi:hypothetical protein [Methylobacter sp. YRD-M1]|uniref:hypothetical protein n=1 Tax=Methylobacter sp. YRD-M1 TaxID=2911520 RepID=UPI003FA3C925